MLQYTFTKGKGLSAVEKQRLISTGENENFRLHNYFYFWGAWLSEWLRRWSNKPDVVGSIPVTTEFFLISYDSNQVPR